MGLFDFAANMGKKLFGDDDAEAADKIKQAIEADTPGITGLDVKYEDGIVHLHGKAETTEALEKAILIAGNVKGVTEVNIYDMDFPKVSETQELPDDIEYYVIESGDSLSKIAKQFYGNAMDYPKLFEANREVIKDADLIYPGQKIRIPPKTW